MPTPKTPIDMSEYMPDEALADAMADEPARYNKDVDPKLRERLAELRSRGSSPSLPRVAPPSEAAYVAPTRPPVNNVTLPRAAKVNVSPSRESERETQPSLKRLEGEPELPGVERRRRQAPVSARTAAIAMLAVLAPVVLVIALMGRDKRQQGTNGAAPVMAASTPAVTGTAAASVVPSATAVPIVTATAEQSAAPGVVPAPRVPAQPARPRATAQDDPYDAAPPSPTSAPSEAPSAAPPTTQPTSKGPSAPAQQPEF